jgi:hypothetical protein
MDIGPETTEAKNVADGCSMQRLVRLSSRVNWDSFCDEMVNSLPELKSFLECWCGCGFDARNDPMAVPANMGSCSIRPASSKRQEKRPGKPLLASKRHGFG